jgi:hypothetical protein
MSVTSDRLCGFERPDAESVRTLRLDGSDGSMRQPKYEDAGLYPDLSLLSRQAFP